MEKYLKPKMISIWSLNNKEYLNMMLRVLDLLVSEEIIKKFGVEVILTPLLAWATELEDLVNRTTAQIETKTMKETDIERVGYISNLFSLIRAARNSPFPACREAHARLKLIARAYKGLAYFRNMEKTVSVRALLVDLEKETAAADIATLALTDTVAALRTTNDRYAALTDARAAKRSAARVSTSRTLRTQMNVLYDNLVTRIMAVNIIQPCEEAENFLLRHNQIATETENAYALRRSSAVKKTAAAAGEKRKPEVASTAALPLA